METKFNLHSRLSPAMRRVFFYSPMRSEALKLAYENSKTIKKKVTRFYRCSLCSHLTPSPVVDHIEPVVPLHWKREGKYWDWSVFINRLFYGTLQVLCKQCHKKKTDAENTIRRRENNV